MIRILIAGITNDLKDPSVDTFRLTTLPILKRFDVQEGLDLKIESRGAAPNGGGEVLLTVPIVRDGLKVSSPIGSVNNLKFVSLTCVDL